MQNKEFIPVNPPSPPCPPLVDTTADPEQSRLQSAIRILEHERNRISLNLHDTIGYRLTAAKYFIDHAINSASPSNIRNVLLKVNNILTEAAQETRQLCFDLMPRALQNAGLEAALNQLFATFSMSGPITLKTKLNLKDSKLAPHLELDLFRIIQELLSNAIRHGAPTQIMLSLSAGKELVQLRFADNGSGFDTGRQHTGSGLKNISMRVASHGGLLRISSVPFKTTRFTINIPYPQKPHDVVPDQNINC